MVPIFTNNYSAVKIITGKSPVRESTDPPTNLKIAQIEEFRRIKCNLELCRFSETQNFYGQMERNPTLPMKRQN